MPGRKETKKREWTSQATPLAMPEGPQARDQGQSKVRKLAKSVRPTTEVKRGSIFQRLATRCLTAYTIPKLSQKTEVGLSTPAQEAGGSEVVIREKEGATGEGESFDQEHLDNVSVFHVQEESFELASSSSGEEEREVKSVITPREDETKRAEYKKKRYDSYTQRACAEEEKARIYYKRADRNKREARRLRLRAADYT